MVVYDENDDEQFDETEDQDEQKKNCLNHWKCSTKYFI